MRPHLDGALPRDWGGEDHQTWGKTDTNDFWIEWAKDTKVIEEIRFRIDLRNVDRPFIDLVLGIAKRFQLQLKLIHVELLDPTVENVMTVLDRSDAKRYVQDPMKFIEGLGDQQ
ncbi:MAG: hypothetical protein IPK70_14450 [Flavobacteriales bacterium]|nr:hypothetical protein [Flavobacteriales bacterium]